jgi:peptidoglycan/LPS O-acetylase OafA/YrhL
LKNRSLYSESKRVEYLDSIRGLAALFVLFSHATSAFQWPDSYLSYSHWPFVSILFDGKEAVCMFFVLSGFVLSKPYVFSVENPSPRQVFLPTFYTRRFTRIWLPWFFVFLASIFARKYLFFPVHTNPPFSSWFSQLWRVPLTARDFFLQCAFMLHDAYRQLIMQDWSLGVELKGSVLIPLFLFLAAGQRVFFLLALAVALAVLGNNGHYYVSFVIGVLLARYGELVVLKILQSRWLTRALVLVLGLSLYQIFDVLAPLFPHSRSLYKCGWIASSLGCAVVLLAVFGSRSLQKCLSTRPMVFLGRISYSVYLLQLIIIFCLLPPLLRLANNCGLAASPGLFMFMTLAAVVATVACSAITYRLVEVRAINLGHWLTREIQRRWRKPA